MPTTGTVLGKNMLVSIGQPGVVISCQGDATLSVERSTNEAVCKDSGAWAQAIPGRASWTLEVSNALFAFDATYGYNQLYTAFANTTLVKVTFTTGVSGDKRFVGDAYVTNLSVNAPIDGATTYNITLSGYGSLTYENVP